MNRYTPLLILVLALTVSCRNDDSEGAPIASAGAQRRAPQATGSDTGLALSVYAVRDTVRSTDPVEVGVLVRNSGAPLRFRNDPQFFHFEVVGPDGRPARRSDGQLEPASLGDVAELTLPRGGIVGQVTNLRCAAAPFETERGPAGCLWGYTLSESGPYKVVVSYSAPPAPAGPSARRQPHLKSDTLTLFVQR